MSKNHNTYRNNFSEEFLNYLSNKWKSEENPQKKDPKFGKRNPFYGKHHSEESRYNNSIAHKIKYKCPFCEYVNNKSWITRHINTIHADKLIRSASTIESIIYEKYIDE